MPKEWHDRHAANKIEDETKRAFYRSIVADKKPYFMRYIYPSLMKQYNTYIKNINRNALREFQMTIDELRSVDENNLTERQIEFLRYCDYRMPVGVGDCVMNRICRKFEEAFDGYISRVAATRKFDYTIMKSGAEYTKAQYYAIKRLYDDYNKRLDNYAVFAAYERVDEFDSFSNLITMNAEFSKACSIVCPNVSTLCDIILDICYHRSSTKLFAWNMCGSDIIRNLFNKNGNTIFYPAICEDGEFEYCGRKYKMESVEIGVNE